VKADLKPKRSKAATISPVSIRKPGAGVGAGPWRTLDRLQEWLNFITTELHKNFSPLFPPAISDEVKAFFKDRVAARPHVQTAMKMEGLPKAESVADNSRQRPNHRSGFFCCLAFAFPSGIFLSEFYMSR
jgi:hypothetical protein